MSSLIDILFYMTGIFFTVAVILFVVSIKNIRDEIPDEDREYMDPLPPLLKFVWPIVKFFGHYIGDYLSAEYVEKLKKSLQKGGLFYVMDPVQFFSLRLVSGIAFAIIGWYVSTVLTYSALIIVTCTALLGFYLPLIDLLDRKKKRVKIIQKMLPVFLDYITMSVEAGLNLTGALAQAVDKGPKGSLRTEFKKVMRDIKSGMSRIDSLRNMTERLEIKEVNTLVSALAQAEKTGSSIGRTLRIQANQRRTERFQRAEKLALEAPVKLIFPLVAFIFPTTFLILAFPIVMKFMHEL